MRTLLGLLAIGAGAYVWSQRGANQREGQARAAFADDQSGTGDNPVRDSGPDAMRDPSSRDWSGVDEASDQSFPASDPPANY
jgi:hypothetical protein